MSADGLDTLAERVERALGRPVERDRPIGPMTTYRVGGSAAVFARIEDEHELHSVGEVVGDVAVLVVGRGSNLLVADTGFAGLALAPVVFGNDARTGNGRFHRFLGGTAFSAAPDAARGDAPMCIGAPRDSVGSGAVVAMNPAGVEPAGR